MEYQSIYNIIVGKGELLPHHREELIQKRGFDNDVIDKLKFLSGGKYILNKFSKEELEFIPDNFKKILTSDKIIIPYLSPESKILHLRPHKLGFPGAGIDIYTPFPLFEGRDCTHLVLAESEFKAAASCVMGVPAIGIPGISSFSKNHIEDLVKLLNRIGCKKITVCFDQEIKNDPKYSNFKPDFTKRYDTLIYEYLMAYQLRADHEFETAIAKLRPEWMVDGKADIDGILAQGISHKAYKFQIDSAVDDKTYRSSWKLPDTHKSYVERRIDRFLYKGPVSHQFKSYKKDNKTLSNFLIKINYTVHDDEEGAERYCYLESNYGNSRQIILKPDMMVSKASFQKFCYGLGDYEFYGSDQDLQKIWSYVFLHQDGRHVRRLRYMGYDKDSDSWFFANGAYHKGVFYPADDDSIVWIEDAGFMLPVLSFGGSKDENVLCPNLSPEKNEITLTKIYENISKCVDPRYSKIILGWTIGTFFMPEILKEWKVYPFLFFYGKQQSGKSTLSNWITSFFGFTQNGVPFSGSTFVGISLATSSLSMIPVWLEEYRNKDDQNINKKNSLLRSIYDKSTIVKGTQRPGVMKTYTARSTLIISGEEQPIDSALNSRCIMVPVFKHTNENSQEGFNWMHKHSSTFNHIGHDLIVNKAKYWPQVKEKIQSYIDGFDSQIDSVDSRSKIHMSIIAGICDTFIEQTQEFVDFVGETTIERTKTVDLNQALFVFLEDLFNMWGTKGLDTEVITTTINAKNKKEEVAFWFNGAYHMWENGTRGIREMLPSSKQAIRSHLRSEEYYIRERTARIGNKVYNCFILNRNHPKFPETLQSMLESKEFEQKSEGEAYGIKPATSRLIFGEKE